MKFYHCFNTSLPDQFIEANSGQLIRWVDGWKTNPYLVRSRIIDGAQINLNGNAKRDEWPELGCGSTRMLDLWMKNKGANYNGRYWESLEEDQRSAPRKSSDPWGAAAAAWLTPGAILPLTYANQAAGPGLTTQDIIKAMALMKNSLISPGMLGGVDRPALKREGVVAGEVVGYRCWKIERGLLRSVYQKDVWLPGQVLEGRELGDWDQRGIHAWKDKGSKEYHDYIRSYLNQADDPFGRHLYFLGGDERPVVARPAMVTGTVFLWGDVVEHERGWRAEFARIRSLDWLYPDETMMGREQEALAGLRATYSVTSKHEAP